MKKIALTQGQFALVDDEDYDYLMQWKWYAHRGEKKHTYYALRMDYKNGKKTIRMHNVIFLKHGINGYTVLDHIDRDGLNNQKDNLRISSRSENCFNRRNWGALPKGVRLHKSVYKKKNGEIKEYVKYQSRISVNGESIFLGNFKDLIDAIESYNKASKIHYPNCV